jgi:molybdate transport system ATP-binding protein
MSLILKLDNLNVKRDNTLVFENFCWQIFQNENWAVIGKSGSGKTTLFCTLEGKYPITEGKVVNYFDGKHEIGTYSLKPHIAFMYFQDQEINYTRYYYQQRYYSTEVEGTLTTKGFLEVSDLETLQCDTKALLNILSISKLLDKEFIKLSNGETRKVLIAKALLKEPKMMILDNPYLGLDEPSRKNLNLIIDEIAKHGIQIIMASPEEYLPNCINRYLYIDNFKITAVLHEKLPVKSQKEKPDSELHFPKPPLNGILTAFKFTNLLVKYGETIIIDRVDWHVKYGEKWALTGWNGSGKSMLLSLVYADHPQAYANEVIILDKVRGKGESIWEIKEKIGYVSPEMHFYIDQQQICDELVLGGITENPYNPKAITEEHVDLLTNLLHFYNLEHLKNKKFMQLSTSEQTLFLLFRAILKNPFILLLDEPFHNFDREMIIKTKILLNTFCKDRTLVFVSHHPGELPEIINNFAHLANGKLTFKQGISKVSFSNRL